MAAGLFVPATHAKISNGTSLSGEVDLRGLVVVSIAIPSSWTAAKITFQGSEKLTAEGGTFGNIFLDPGTAAGPSTELTMDAIAGQINYLAGANVSSLILGNCVLKIRSGTNAAAVNQAADRDITIYLRPF